MSNTASRMYAARTAVGAAVPLAANVAKTVVAMKGSPADTFCLRRWRVSFNSVTATDLPAQVEVGIITTLGTLTAMAPVQMTGSSIASAGSAGTNATVEPTFDRIFEVLYVPVQQGIYEIIFPLGEEPQCDPGQGMAIRVTAPQAANCHASLFYIE